MFVIYYSTLFYCNASVRVRSCDSMFSKIKEVDILTVFYLPYCNGLDLHQEILKQGCTAPFTCLSIFILSINVYISYWTFGTHLLFPFFFTLNFTHLNFYSFTYFFFLCSEFYPFTFTSFFYSLCFYSRYFYSLVFTCLRLAIRLFVNFAGSFGVTGDSKPSA